MHAVIRPGPSAKTSTFPPSTQDSKCIHFVCLWQIFFTEVIMRVGNRCTKRIVSWVTRSSGCKQASHIWTVAFMPVTSVRLKAYISENKQKSQEKQQTFGDSWWITTASKINGEKFEIQMISECLLRAIQLVYNRQTQQQTDTTLMPKSSRRRSLVSSRWNSKHKNKWWNHNRQPYIKPSLLKAFLIEVTAALRRP